MDREHPKCIICGHSSEGYGCYIAGGMRDVCRACYRSGRMREIMVCGHHQREVVSSDEGISYCAGCERESRERDE